MWNGFSCHHVFALDHHSINTTHHILFPPNVCYLQSRQCARMPACFYKHLFLFFFQQSISCLWVNERRITDDHAWQWNRENEDLWRDVLCLNAFCVATQEELCVVVSFFVVLPGSADVLFHHLGCNRSGGLRSNLLYDMMGQLSSFSADGVYQDQDNGRWCWQGELKISALLVWDSAKSCRAIHSRVCLCVYNLILPLYFTPPPVLLPVFLPVIKQSIYFPLLSAQVS